jgi:futalosine hydrolase
MPGAGGYSRGLLRNRECFFLLTGVGPVCAALAFGAFAGAFRRAATGTQCLPAVLNAGLAGSYDLEAAPVGSLALADEELWPEYGVATASGVNARALGFPLHAADTGPEIWDRVPLDPERFFRTVGLNPIPAARGLSVTVAGTSGDGKRAALLRRSFAPLMENMEAFPLALACLRFGWPFLNLRGLSNPVGVRDKGAWRIPAALAALEAGLRASVKGA